MPAVLALNLNDAAVDAPVCFGAGRVGFPESSLPKNKETYMTEFGEWVT